MTKARFAANTTGWRLRADAVTLLALAAAVCSCSSDGGSSRVSIGRHASPSATTGERAPDSVSGTVLDENGPVFGAVVRVKATKVETRTDAAGRFTLSDLVPGEPVTVTAWAPGYFNAGGDGHLPGASNVSIELEPHAEVDNPSYAWVSAFGDAGDEANCENCHSEPGNPDSSLPFDQWVRDAHAGSAENVRFLTMYAGTDVHGNQSPFARFGDSRRFSGTDPLVPDPEQPYYGPGFKLDYPYIAGSCSACHVPSGDFTSTYGADPTTASGVGMEGSTCDLCHKIWDVNLEPDTGLPNRDRPGILSYAFLRPPEGHQFFAGPLDDVAPGEDTYSPLQRESAYCAGCHHGVFWDTTVYDSFGEWLDSPYSDPDLGRTCQDCHMPADAATRFARSDKGGLERSPVTIVSHLMRGITDEAFMKDAVTMAVDARMRGSTVSVDVRITNDKTGHDVPTDSPLRHLILLVRAASESGAALTQTDGPRIPDWGGIGDPAKGYYAGLPGTVYAKVLQEFRSELFPTGAYWNPTRVLSDNRIPAFGSDTTSYAFDAPLGADVTVDVSLLHRRAYIDLADQKGWSDPDMIMAHQTVQVEGPR